MTDIIQNKKFTDWAKIKAYKRKRREEKIIKELEKKKRIEEDELTRAEIKKSDMGRHFTVSIALPGSILDNAQSPALRSYLGGQIARAAVVFNVDEIIIFDESGSASSQSVEGDGVLSQGKCNIQLARILQYLECPQYLRKHFFPMHKDLEFAGVCNPLDSAHHAKASDTPPFREGVVVDKQARKGCCLVDVGLKREVQVDQRIRAGMRVTVKMADTAGKKPRGTVVSPQCPRTEHGLYWGYTVRLASSLSSVLTQSPHADGYDLTIGTSERGSCIDDVTFPTAFNHALIVFGGVHGLETSLDADHSLHIDNPGLLFDHYLNTCPGQGSNTIRTEEAILITLSALRPKLSQAQKSRLRRSLST